MMDKLSDYDTEKYSRQIMLDSIGYNGQLKLKNSKVCVVGVGGLGHPIIQKLASMGIGTLRLVDRDIIEISNLPRQILFNEHDVNMVKVEIVANKIKENNPTCKVEPIAMSIIDENVVEIIKGCDLVIDALDNIKARYSLNRACVMLNIPLISSAGVGENGQVLTVIPYQCACYSCIFPELYHEEMPNCSIEGVNPAILSIIAGVVISETIKILTGNTPSLKNKLLYVNLDFLTFTTKNISMNKQCEVCND